MELNKKILHRGLFLIGVFLMFTIVFGSVYKLKNPVFLKMFVEKGMYNNENPAILGRFEIKYLTNISDNRKVVNIQFKENLDIGVTVSNDSFDDEDMPFFNGSNNKQRENKYGIYVVNTIDLNIDLKNIDKKINQIELNNIKVTFNDGSTLNSNLGRIILYKNEEIQEDIESIGVGSSSDGEEYSRKKLKENIKLLKVESPLLDDTKDYFNLYIDGIDYKDVLGSKYEKDTILTSHSNLKIPNSTLKKYSYYEIHPKLYYEDTDAKRSYVFTHRIQYSPNNFDFIGIFKYLKLRGEI